MALARKKPPLAQWVEEAMKHAGGMSQAELARAMADHLHAEVDRSIVNKIVLGKRKLMADEMFAIEDITKYPLTAISHSHGAAIVRQLLKNGALTPGSSAAGQIQIPILDRVTAGKLKAPTSQIPVEDVPLLAFADLGRGEFFALRLEDDADSMDRVSPPGSIVIVNKADRELRNGKCYIFSIDGETTYKMWQDGDPAYLAPYSTNPSHKPIFVKGKRGFDVIGRVKRTVLDL